MPLEAVRFIAIIATPYQYFHCRIWKYLGPSASIHWRGRKARQFRLEKDDPRGFLNRPERGKAQSTDAHCDEGPLAIHFRALAGRGGILLSFVQPHVQPKQADHNNGDD
jgi:hypothetical protein